MAKMQSKEDEETMRAFREQFLSGTNHYCPECGETCSVSDAEYAEDIDPVKMTVKCEKCGEFVIERKNGLYFWNDVPYIPGMDTNSATVLFRRDPDAPLETEDDYFELAGLLMDVSDGYRDNYNFEQHIDAEKKLIDLVHGSVKKGYKGLVQIATIAYSRIAEYYSQCDETDLAKRTLVEGLEYTKTLTPLTECAYIFMCLQNGLLPIAQDEIGAAYDDLKEADLDTIEKEADERFASAMFCNILSGISEALGKDDDYKMLTKRSLDRYLELYDGGELSDEEFEAICSEYYQNITVMNEPKELCEEFVKFTESRGNDIWYCNALLKRYIAYMNDRNDRSEDLDVIVDRLAEHDDLDGRYCRANALLFRATYENDKRKSLKDISLAFDLIVANIREGDDVDDVAKSIIISYLSAVRRADSKKYDASIRTLKELDISKGDIRRWTEEFSKE